MMASPVGQSLADAAQALVGSGFRLHGRHPVTGLDCVGVLSAALTAIGRKAALPDAYRLRSRAIPDLSRIAADCGMVAVIDALQAGDVLLAKIGSCQFHVLITAENGCVVHAHAGLGRVIIEPISDDWQIAGHWRLIPTN